MQNGFEDVSRDTLLTACKWPFRRLELNLPTKKDLYNMTHSFNCPDVKYRELRCLSGYARYPLGMLHNTIVLSIFGNN